MAVKKKKMPLRTGLPVWGWMAGAVLITAVVALGSSRLRAAMA